MQTIIPLTIGQVARDLNAPLYTIRYILRTRKIEPVGRAGIIRMFDEPRVEAIRQALAEIRSTSRGQRAKRGWAGWRKRKQQAAAVAMRA
jgi:hypothetical protein